MDSLRPTHDWCIRRIVLLLGLGALGLGFGGCSAKTLDPSQIGRFRPTPAVNVILKSLGVAEEAPVAWENAQEPQPGDIVAVKTDYALRPGDVVRISIFELLQEGAVVVNDYTVSETGQVSVPEVGVIPAGGLTERQLEDEIKRILSPAVLRNPSVTVSLQDSQQRTFSILGNAVARPSRYLIPHYDFRLADALATAGVQMQFNVSTIYVSRREEPAGESAQVPVPPRASELELLEPGTRAKTSAAVASPLPTGSPGRPPAEARDPQSALPRSARNDLIPNPQPIPGIPEPSEPAQQFESQRKMLDLIAPRAQDAWPPSRRLTPVSAVTGQGDVTASVVPEDSPGQTPHGYPQQGGRDTRDRQGQGGLVTQAWQQNVLIRRFQEQDSLATGDPGRRIPAPAEVSSLVEFGTANMTTPTQELAPVPASSKTRERTEWIFRDGKWVAVVVTDGDGPAAGSPETETGNSAAGTPVPGEQPMPPAAPDAGKEWVLRDGRWVLESRSGSTAAPAGQTAPLPSTGKPAPSAPPAPAKVPQDEGSRSAALPQAGPERLPMEAEWEQAIQTRLIRIPADKLLAGDPRYNIVIKPGDTIHVPVDIIGEFAIMGNVNRSGYIDLTGRPMTLKQAIAAAGGLGPLASPKNVEVIRRIGTAREEIVMVDLDKIATGEQPDFFIKPNDLINVGTDLTARWRAVLRNAFRATYGFGFVYDRNFADIDYGTGFPWLRNF